MNCATCEDMCCDGVHAELVTWARPLLDPEGRAKASATDAQKRAADWAHANPVRVCAMDCECGKCPDDARLANHSKAVDQIMGAR